MTPEQKRQLIAVCEDGDDVKAVTLCLQIAAWNARSGLRDTAIACRRLVDELSDADARRGEYMQKRLEIAAHVSPALISKGSMEEVAAEAIRYADTLIEALSAIEIGG